MDVFVVFALLGIALLLAELLLSTGGVLAALGAGALIAGGVLALTADAESSASDWAGPALITLGVLSLVSVYFVTRKVIAAREERVQTGSERLIGSVAEARTALDPGGQVAVAGAIWRARLAGDGPARLRPGDRVKIEAVEGLTLVVRPEKGGG